MTPEQVIGLIQDFGEPEIMQFVGLLCAPCELARIPVDGLLTLAKSIAEMIDAKTEQQEMQDAEKAIDAESDAEATAIFGPKK